ncbi:hypothetical protein CN890_18255 [Priestia megaterium]|jgi:redox-sensitive bicupin YhaK (pirin superfamily)|uniref:pirin family protein n=2 Tax=Priestia megaterium TaxID=1404 RepID=UPI000BFDBFDD|nr:pirin family protein [Priestia megaterium]MDP1471582.1 pirin family protein [Priestia megaterium]PGH68314.1 hypothetical protein CN890_18255 [Priestia megaterium]PGO40454.1 hypothetical protein CN973_08335 [Priestia megaterium]
MIQILKALETPPMGGGLFRLRMVRPGQIFHKPLDDLAFGPLSRIDHANLGVGAVVSMHEHRNDEILSYMWRGQMVHEDSTGDIVKISPQRHMMMNAGTSFYHEESVPEEHVEMLQIFIRPEEKDLPPRVQFYDKPESFEESEWELLAGPQGTKAPLTIRQRVMVLDSHPKSGKELKVPEVEGMVPWVYVMDGNISVGDKKLNKGDAITDTEEPLPLLHVDSDATIVTFLVDLSAKATLAGLFSGYRS